MLIFFCQSTLIFYLYALPYRQQLHQKSLVLSIPSRKHQPIYFFFRLFAFDDLPANSYCVAGIFPRMLHLEATCSPPSLHSSTISTALLASFLAPFLRSNRFYPSSSSYLPLLALFFSWCQLGPTFWCSQMNLSESFPTDVPT